MTSNPCVLFVCMASSARSQMAEALLRNLDSCTFEALSGYRALEALGIPVGEAKEGDAP